MLRGLIAIHETFEEEFDEIKAFCDQNDIEIYRFDSTWCSVLAKPKKMYKLMKFVKKHDRRVTSIELAD